MTDLAAEYDRLCHTPSDIWEHLPTFYDLVIEADATKVIELGTRAGVSTIAWLHALARTGGHLWSVDVDGPPSIDAGHWTFVRGDDLDPAVVAVLPDDADIVFVDTLHHYGQTRAELEVYRWKVRAGGLIVCHDTALRRPIGAPPADPPFPVLTAITEFVADEALTWTQNERCFGLGIIQL